MFKLRTPLLPSVTSTFLPVLALVIAMVSFQLGASLAKNLFPLVGAQGTTALRLLFSAIVLLCYFRPWRIRLKPRAWRIITLYGLALGGMNFLFYMAIRTVPLGIAVAFEFAGPLTVALFASRRLVDFIWISLACAGLSMLLPLTSYSSLGLDPIGVMYAIGSALCCALYIIFGQRAGITHGHRTVAIAVSIAAIAAFPFGIAQAGSKLFSPEILPLGIGVAILSSAIPYSLEMYVLTRLSAKTFGTLLSLEPAFAAISGLIFLNESLNSAQWVAILAIIAASAGVTTSRSKKSLIT